MVRIHALTLVKPMSTALPPWLFCLAPDRGRHDHAQTPRPVDARAVGARCLDEAEHHVRHYELGHAAAEVAPAAGSRIGSANDRACEHLRAPDLARHEGGERETDQEACGNERAGALCEGEGDDARDAEPEQQEEGLTGAELVAERAGQNAHRDGTAHCGRAGVGDVGAGEADAAVGGRAFDVWHQRGGREHREEGAKEAERRYPEGVHVRLWCVGNKALKERREELGRLVLRVDRDGESAAVNVGHASRVDPLRLERLVK
eukprot:scaffold186181_cov25-Tisochrysis_lutea.AAC.2